MREEACIFSTAHSLPPRSGPGTNYHYSTNRRISNPCFGSLHHCVPSRFYAYVNARRYPLTPQGTSFDKPPYDSCCGKGWEGGNVLFFSYFLAYATHPVPLLTCLSDLEQRPELTHGAIQFFGGNGIPFGITSYPCIVL
jgi:hypothetical protein